MIELKFHGRGAAFYPIFGNTNACFVRDDCLYCLDFGESAFEKVNRLYELSQFRHIYAIITHLHADHAGSLASLCSYAAMVKHVPLTIVHPEETVVSLLTLEGIDPLFYEWRRTMPEDCPVQVKPIEVKHAGDMRCYGYEVTDGEETIYFSGDSADIPVSVIEGYLEGRIARVYHDTSSHESAGHCYYKKLEVAFPPEQRKNVFCMHLDGDYVDMLRQLGFSVVETERLP